MVTVEIISEYIAPWGLPNETMPIHLLWSDKINFDEIQILLPHDVIIEEFLNVDSFIQKNQEEYIITELKTPNFFGFNILLNSIFNDSHIKREINVSFKKDGEILLSKKFIANIFRPFVTLVESPKEVVIEDNTRLDQIINVTLRLSGFGKVTLYNEISTGGEFKAQAEPLFREIIRGMVSTFETMEPKKPGGGITINPKYLEDTTVDYINKIRDGILPNDIKEELLKDFSEWVKDESNNEQVMRLIKNSIENMLISSILFHLEKHPESNITMPEGIPSIILNDVTEEVRLRFRYEDALNNKYDPISLKIKLINNSSKVIHAQGIPINITWEIYKINPLEMC